MSAVLPTISACLVVHNEEAVIERCLQSIAGLVDEIVVVHDGPCSDATLTLAAKYTDRIYVRPYIGIAEPHRSFTFTQAQGIWILQIDADEYFETDDWSAIQALTKDMSVSGYYFTWEFWDGHAPVYVRGLQKLVLFRKDKVSFQGLPQKEPTVDGVKQKTALRLHHRPIEENVSWAAANKKRRYWLQAHVPYFFPELVTYNCFNTTIDSWRAYTDRVRQHPWLFIMWYPLKNFLGQLKNGLWTNRLGLRIALQQYVYYATLYWRVRRQDRALRK